MLEKEDEHKTEHKPVEDKFSPLDYWRLATGALAILLIISVFTGGFGHKSLPGDIVAVGAENAISQEEASQKAMDYVNNNLLQPGTEAELKGIEERDSLYLINMQISGREYGSFITKDGRYLFPSGFDLDEEIEKPRTNS